MIDKKSVDDRSVVDVTFALPADWRDSGVAVVGDFNGWDPSANPLRVDGDRCVATITVPSGRRYVFRYHTADGRWFNDDAADAYQPNEFGGHDCVLDVT